MSRKTITLTHRRGGWTIAMNGKYIPHLASDELLWAVARTLMDGTGPYGGFKTPSELHEDRRKFRAACERTRMEREKLYAR